MSTVGGFVPLPRVIIGRGPVYLRCLCEGSLSRTATAAVPSRFITRRAYVQSSHDELADRARGETEGGDRSASESDTTQRPGSSSLNAPTIPSNKAHPTLNNGRQSPNVDKSGELLPNVPEDVKQHNREMEQRYDRAYNRIADKGTVEKGAWEKDRN